jgi:hypothetical protein
MANHWIWTLRQWWERIPSFYVRLVMANAVIIFCMFSYLHFRVYKVHQIEQIYLARNHAFTLKLVETVQKNGVDRLIIDMDQNKAIVDQIDGQGKGERVDLIKMYQSLKQNMTN